MIVPSIDIMGGRAVQLLGGKKEFLVSLENPVDLARRFNRFGEVAVIDLDAALARGDNRELIKEICRVADVRTGGGIRTAAIAEEYLRAGARKIIIGTKANEEFLSRFPRECIQVALDSIDGEVVDQGWSHRTGETIFNRAERLAPFCQSFLITFVDKEGSKGGLPVELAETLTGRLKHPLTLAGGVRDTENAASLLKLGVDLQVGTALYTGSLNPAEAFSQSLDWRKQDLLPTIVRDQSGTIRMLAYSSRNSLIYALNAGKGIYYSRSRREIWEKGLTSGNTQELLSARWDCDRDALLFTVNQKGPSCHTGQESCFGDARFSLEYLLGFLSERKKSAPPDSYTRRLLENTDLLNAKLTEEAAEVVESRDRENLIWELADLTYFMLCKAAGNGINYKEIVAELARRHK